LLFRDLIRLFACYNDGIINLLEKYFDMNKKNCRDALDQYKKFLIRMDRVAEFLKVAENVGVEKGDIPDLAKAPSSLLEALEAHLANLEGRKVGSPTTPPTGGATSSGIADPKVQQQLLAEEEQAMAKYKEQAKSTGNPFASAAPATAAAPAPAAAAAAAEPVPNILDLFGMSDAPAPAAVNTSGSDLLQLSGNPFANIVNQAGSTGGGGSAANSSNAALNNGPGSGFFGDILQPQGAGNNLFGSNMPQPMVAANSAAANTASQKMVTGDLDASLANLTSNLNLTSGHGKSSNINNTRGPPMMMNNPASNFNTTHQTRPMVPSTGGMQQPLYPQQQQNLFM